MPFQISFFRCKYVHACASGAEINYLGSASRSLERFCTLCDAVPHDFHVIVAIGPRLLVPEAQSVEELVLDGGDAVAVGADGQPLLPDVAVSHRRETAEAEERKNICR